MSFVGIVGKYKEDTEGIPIVGNGKTLVMIFYLYLAFLKGFKVYCNVETSFAIYMTVKEMLEGLRRKEILNSYLGFDEITKYLNSMGAPARDTVYSEGIFGQIRKLKNQAYWTGQNWKSCNSRVRNLTNIILKPYKTHLDYKPCYDPLCTDEHLIFIYCDEPMIEKAITNPLIASVVGKLYKTDFFIDDEPLNIPKNPIKSDLTKADLKGNGESTIKIPKNTPAIIVKEIRNMLKKWENLPKSINNERIPEI